MDWLKTLRTVAPTIATAVGGPLAGMAMKMVSDAVGGDLNEDSLKDMVLAGNPETLLKLKQADQDFKVTMRELGIKEEQLSLDDRKSARDLAKSNMTPQIILSAIYTSGYLAVLWQFVTGEVIIPAQSQAAFSIILGVLTAAQTQILNFWFGSSSGSKVKTDYMSGK